MGFVQVIPTESGLNWTVCSISEDGYRLIAGGYAKRLWTSIDKGNTWSEMRPNGDANKFWEGVAQSLDGTKILAGEVRLWYSSDGGDNWSELRPIDDQDYSWRVVKNNISSDGTKLCAVTDRMYYSSNSGSSWAELRPNGDVDAPWHVSMSSDGTKFFAADGTPGRSYYSSNSGANWTEVIPTGSYEDRYWAHNRISSDGTRICVYNISVLQGAGRVYYTSDSGVTWNDITPFGVSKNWANLAMSSDGTKILISPQQEKTLYISYNCGVSWEDISPTYTDPLKNWYGMDMFSSNMIIIGSISGLYNQLYLYKQCENNYNNILY